MATPETHVKKAAKAAKSQRAYDYLYGECALGAEQKGALLCSLGWPCALTADPLFTVSSEADHHRAGLRARATTGRFVSLGSRKCDKK